MQNDRVDNWYRKHGQEPPERVSHDLVPDDIKNRVKELKPTNWRQNGNRLIADTEMGQLVQFLPTDKLLTGTDENGLPIFKTL